MGFTDLLIIYIWGSILAIVLTPILMVSLFLFDRFAALGIQYANLRKIGLYRDPLTYAIWEKKPNRFIARFITHSILYGLMSWIQVLVVCLSVVSTIVQMECSPIKRTLSLSFFDTPSEPDNQAPNAEPFHCSRQTILLT